MAAVRDIRVFQMARRFVALSARAAKRQSSARTLRKMMPAYSMNRNKLDPQLFWG